MQRAFAAEDKNPDIPYAIGEALRMRSWDGAPGYKGPAEEAIPWFKRSAALNPYDPWKFEPRELSLIPGLIVLASLVGFLPGLTAYRTDVAESLSG